MFKKLFGFGKKKEETQIKEEDLEIEALEQPEDESEIDQSEEEIEELEQEKDQSEEEIEQLEQKVDQSEEEIGSHMEVQEESQMGEAQEQAHEEREDSPEEIIENQEEVQEPEDQPEDPLDESEEDEFKDEPEEELEEELEEETIDLEDDVDIALVLETEDLQEDTEASESTPAPEKKLGFFAKLKKGLTDTSKNFTSKLESLFSGYTKVDDEIFEELEELLILADLGFDTAIGISEELRKRSEEKKIEEVSVLENELQNIIEEILIEAAHEEEEAEETQENQPEIMVIVGVNGVGKTTSIGKIAMQLKNEGKSVMLAAGDTFRAAAADQLTIWADRAGVPIVKSNEGADPSAVIFDAIKSAKAKNIDVLICDTAGRLHNKKNLMIELEKIFRIINREYPEAKKETLLVIDATTGQNALSQAKTFSEVAPLTGLVLTKLDGTAKGGVVIGLSKELSIPIKYVGVGEKIDDLQKFDARDFAKALFSKN